MMMIKLLAQNLSIVRKPHVVAVVTFAAIILVMYSPFYPLLDTGSPNYKTYIYTQLSLPGSSLPDAIRHSELFRLAHACCLTASLPMFFDILLDFYEKFMNISTDVRLTERIFFFASLVLPSAIFLRYRNEYSMPYMFIALTEMQSICIALLIWIAVIPDFIIKAPEILPVGSYFLVLLFVIRNVLRLYDAIYDFSPDGKTCIQVVTFVNYILAVLGGSLWFFRTMKRSSGSIFNLSFKEYQCAIYLNAIFIYSMCTLASDYANNALSWYDANEADLVTYAFVQLFIAVIVTVLPGRLVRMNVMSLNNEILALKRMFVRYVSHEIRSPLNVVHAGLDLLLGDMKSVAEWTPAAVRSMIGVAEDMFSASDSAINILNDLLQYEHMDAGTFKLDLGWKPLLQLLEGKLKWASFMARTKDLVFEMQDDTIVTQEGALALYNKMTASLAEDGEVSEMSVMPSAMDIVSHTKLGQLVLHMDEGKVYQVIRNLLSNAFKFTPPGGKVVLKISSELTNCDPGNAPSTHSSGKDEAHADHGNSVGVLRVEVIDSGAGIADEDQVKVFGEFAQFNRNELQGGGGSGLGLWISRRIITMHDGTIGFHSAGKGHGSTFFFQLPLFSGDAVNLTPPAFATDTQSPSPFLKQSWVLFISACKWPFVKARLLTGMLSGNQDSAVYPSAGSARKVDYLLQGTPDEVDLEGNVNRSDNALFDRQEQIQTIAVGAQHTTSQLVESIVSEEDRDRNLLLGEGEEVQDIHPLHFLIADDSALNRKMVIRLLHSEDRFPDMTIAEADDGEDVVRMVREKMGRGESFDFILMDNIMLKMHGPQAARILRNELKFQGVIIGVTGNVHPDQIADFIQHGANRVLSKPFTKAKLYDEIMESGT